MNSKTPSLASLRHLFEAARSSWARQTFRAGVATDVLMVLIAGAWVCFPFLGQNVSWQVHESRHALIAAEIADTGDFIVPHRLGTEYPDKPPVMHASAAVLYRIFGKVSMALARTPSVLAAILGAVALYGGARVLYGRGTGVFAGLALLTTWAYAEQARIARPDMIFASSILIASMLLVCAMARSERRQRLALFFVGGLAAGLGVLAKGPYGILFPLLAIIFFPAGRPDLRRPRALEWGVLGIAVLLIPISWAIPVYLHDNGQYLSRVVFQRELAGVFELEVNRPPYHYIGIGLEFLLPWSLFLPLVVRHFKLCKGTVLLMIAVMVVLSIVPQRKSYYLLPWYPFAVLAISAVVCRTESSVLLRRVSHVLLMTMLIVMPLFVGVLRPQFRTKGVNHKLEFADRVLSLVTNGSCIIGDVVSEAIALQNFVHGKPIRVRVIDQIKPQELEAKVAECLKADTPCFVAVQETTPPAAISALLEFETEVLLEYEPLGKARLLRVLRHR